MNNKVLLGMSGGVDSTASAIILKNLGYQVIGVTYRLTDEKSFENSINDAKNAADKLNIEHVVIDYRNEFKTRVIDNFVDEYLKGHTPNPCVVCNEFIKFGSFLRTADELGVQFVASGQYAKIMEKNGTYYIVKPENRIKDQTYFLYNSKENFLNRVLFPIGDIISKDETRKIVKDSGIELFSKKDSQEICFIKDEKYTEFIEKTSNKTSQKGNFTDVEGKILGEHQGIVNYTIGQRKGLGIALGKPAFVVDIDSEKNIVVLGDNADLFKTELTLGNYNFINKEYDRYELILTAKIRYAAKEEPVRIIKDKNTLNVKFQNPVRAITKGQSVVFYDGNILVGGGLIK